MSLLQFSEV